VALPAGAQSVVDETASVTRKVGAVVPQISPDGLVGQAGRDDRRRERLEGQRPAVADVDKRTEKRLEVARQMATLLPQGGTVATFRRSSASQCQAQWISQARPWSARRS
jgi:hypothetical protein